MRLPASMTAQPPDAAESAHLAAIHVDPTDVSDVGQAAGERKPWWARVSGVVFTSAAGALIAVTGAIYVGMYHAPWVTNLASHTPTAAQAGDAMSVAMAAGPANAATSAPVPALAAEASPQQPASPDRVAAARDRMEQRVYSQVQQPRARTVAESETIEDSDAPAPGRVRRHHRGSRPMHRGAGPYNAAWYKGA